MRFTPEILRKHAQILVEKETALSWRLICVDPYCMDLR